MRLVLIILSLVMSVLVLNAQFKKWPLKKYYGLDTIEVCAPKEFKIEISNRWKDRIYIIYKDPKQKFSISNKYPYININIENNEMDKSAIHYPCDLLHNEKEFIYEIKRCNYGYDCFYIKGKRRIGTDKDINRMPYQHYVYFVFTFNKYLILANFSMYSKKFYYHELKRYFPIIESLVINGQKVVKHESYKQLKDDDR